MTAARQVVAVATILFLLCAIGFGQLPTGTPLFGSFDQDSVTAINLGNLNIHNQIPVVNKPGKGIPFSAILNHDNVFWYPSGNKWAYTTYGGSNGLDWIGSVAAIQGAPVSYTYAPATCRDLRGTYVYSNWSYVDVFNTSHGTPLQLDSTGCIYGTSGSGTSADGYALSASVSPGASASSGPDSPTAASQGASGNGWTNLPGVYHRNDSSQAQTALSVIGDTFSSDLSASAYNFNIPTTATVTGIQVTVYRSSSGAQGAKDLNIKILKAGTAVGTNHATSTRWPSTSTAATYGSSSDLWGVSWTPSDINNTGFGLSISCQMINLSSNTYCYIDYISITVYYTQLPNVTASVTSSSGMSIANGSYTDPNGNSITVSGSNYYDTLSSTSPVMTKSGSAASGSVSYGYTGGNGSTSATVNYTPYTLQTNFQCANIAEYSQANFPLATSINLPGGYDFTITYEQTPGYGTTYTTGRIQSIQLPAGGKITYTYQGNNDAISCSDGSTLGFQKQVYDGTSTNTWTYGRSYNSSNQVWTTTVSDPLGNTVSINFDKTGSYELQQTVTDHTSGLLKTVVTCYNLNTTNCGTTGTVSIPINRRTVYTQIPDSTGVQSEVDTQYNSISLPTEIDEYDFGASTPTRSTVIAYGTWNSGTSQCVNPIGSNIQDRVCRVTVHSGGSGGPILTDKQNTYGTTGDPSSTSDLVSGTYLSKSFNYSQGVLQSVQDVNATTTTYGSFQCNNAFPDTVTISGFTWTTGMAWDSACNGVVLTSTTDANGNVNSYGHADPFWRQTFVKDPLQNQTNTSYSLSPMSTETTLTFGSSTSDVTQTFDGIGRIQWVQKKQGPSSSSYDTTTPAYDAAGNMSGVAGPGTCAQRSCNPALSGTSMTNDALGRKTQSTDPDGGVESDTYTKNDVLIVLSPHPTGENNKSKQLEYDGLGRLISVCEMTSVSASGNCGQTSPQQGFWTRYQYDAADRLTGVCQNTTVAMGTDCVQNPSAGQQTRTYAYDGLGRMISETSPENGTTYYYFDSAPSTPGVACPGTYNGSLVKKYDANGNTTCYTYDGLKRVLSITYSGPNTTDNKYFVYDAATVNGQAMSNVKSKLAEAYTCTGSCTSKKTEMGMSLTQVAPTDCALGFPTLEWTIR